jgi:hypothetical protein
MTTIHKTLTRWAFLQLFTLATAGVVAAAHVGSVYAAPGHRTLQRQLRRPVSLRRRDTACAERVIRSIACSVQAWSTL